MYKLLTIFLYISIRNFVYNFSNIGIMIHKTKNISLDIWQIGVIIVLKQEKIKYLFTGELELTDCGQTQMKYVTHYSHFVATKKYLYFKRISR